jgi:hypothetical protein
MQGRMGPHQREAFTGDPIKRFISAIYIQAFRDLLFLCDHQEAVAIIDSWPGKTHGHNRRVDSRLIAACELPENRINKILEKLRLNDPRAFFQDRTNIWHQLLPSIGIDLEPEEIAEWAALEVVQRQSETAEALAGR